MTVDLPDSPLQWRSISRIHLHVYNVRRIFDFCISVAENSIDPTLLANYRHLIVWNKLFWKLGYICYSVKRNIKWLIEQNKVMTNCQMSTLIKYSCFACLIWHSPGSCSGATKGSVPRYICLVRVTKTVLVWWISDLDSPKSVSLHCTGLFSMTMFSSAASVIFA